MARKRKPGRKPYGSNSAERKIIELIVLKRRRRRSWSGPTPYYTIATELNDEGYRTRDGKLWRAEQVKRILEKPLLNCAEDNKRARKTQLRRSDFLTPKQITDCRAVFKDEHEKIIFETLFGSALRASELCALQVRDLYLDEPPYQIEVRRGKGAKQRSVVISKKLAELLGRFLDKHKPKRTSPLILNRRYEQLKYKALYYCIKSIGKRAGIPSLHPHVLRHTWATLCDYDTNCFDIADQLGHGNLSTTAIYRKVRSNQRMRTAENVAKQAELIDDVDDRGENISKETKSV